MWSSCLKAANRRGDLLRGRVDAANRLRLVVRERVHRVNADVEAAVCVVDGEHVDRLAVVRERPACSAAR
jgi:hypothetical protein